MNQGARVGDLATAQDVERLGLNAPLHVQFVTRVGQLLRGDLGASVFSNVPVTGSSGNARADCRAQHRDPGYGQARPAGLAAAGKLSAAAPGLGRHDGDVPSDTRVSVAAGARIEGQRGAHLEAVVDLGYTALK